MTLRVRPMVRALSATLRHRVGGAGHSTRVRRGFELELMTADGMLGRGEASPLPLYSLETHEQVQVELAAIGDFVLSFPDTASGCRPFVVDAVERRGCTLPSVRFAFEGALIDLAAQRLGLPAAQLIARMGQNHDDVGQPAALREVELSALLSGEDLPSLCEAAQRAFSSGYRTVKVKMGATEEFEREFALLQSLRTHLDPALRLRLDPNQSWSGLELPRMLNRVSSLVPEFVEEPATWAELLSLGQSPVPLALDESLRSEVGFETLAHHRTRLNLRALVVKPALLGLLRSIEIAEQGRRLGLDVVVTHLFDGPIGLATAASLALALGSRRLAHGLAPHAALQLSPERRVLGIDGGRLYLVDEPGLPIVGTGVGAC